jgi:hypothetical protein
MIGYSSDPRMNRESFFQQSYEPAVTTQPVTEQPPNIYAIEESPFNSGLFTLSFLALLQIASVIYLNFP